MTKASLGALRNGGGTGIRTLEGLLTLAGFQDQCFQPLSHPSAEKSTAFAVQWCFRKIRIFDHPETSKVAVGQRFELWEGY